MAHKSNKSVGFNIMKLYIIFSIQINFNYFFIYICMCVCVTKPFVNSIFFPVNNYFILFFKLWFLLRHKSSRWIEVIQWSFVWEFYNPWYRIFYAAGMPRTIIPFEYQFWRRWKTHVSAETWRRRRVRGGFGDIYMHICCVAQATYVRTTKVTLSNENWTGVRTTKVTLSNANSTGVWTTEANSVQWEQSSSF